LVVQCVRRRILFTLLSSEIDNNMNNNTFILFFGQFQLGGEKNYLIRILINI
jgi:hypothetical protein